MELTIFDLAGAMCRGLDWHQECRVNKSPVVTLSHILNPKPFSRQRWGAVGVKDGPPKHQTAPGRLALSAGQTGL